MKVIFRADSSLDIGTGHIMRCLTLAQALREQEVISCFVCREHAGNLIDLIRRHGFEVKTLPIQDSSQQVANNNIPPLAHAAWLGVDWKKDALQTKTALGGEVFDWMVVDHYAIDSRWERQLRSCYKKIMVIDDLANRLHECDLLLDQNLGRTAQDYASLVPKDCHVLAGPQYALLRPEFYELRKYSLARRVNPTFKRLLISMGGIDKDNATGQVLASLKDCKLPVDMRITVVMGLHAPWLEQVRRQAKELSIPTEVLVSVDNMAQLMADCDLAIGAAGSTSWERCCLGLPTLIVILASNQIEVAVHLANIGAAYTLTFDATFPKLLKRKIESLHDDNEVLVRFANNSRCVTDGKGAARVFSVLNTFNQNENSFILNKLGLLRDIADDELELMRLWRNDPAVRANMYTRHEISRDEHSAWWKRVKESSDQKYYMYELSGVPTGIVAFNKLDNKNHNSAWALYASPLAPKGVGGKMEVLALDYAFNRLHLNKLYCEVLAFNTSVIKLHQKFGFQIEGIFRGQYKLDDVFIDVYRLSLLAEEWQASREAIFERVMTISMRSK